MTIPSKRRHIAFLLLLLIFGDKMPSMLDPFAGSVDDWALSQHVSPQEAQDGYLAAREEERLVKSTVQPISDDVLDWVHTNYVVPSQRELGVQTANFRPPASMGRRSGLPGLLPGEGPDVAGLSMGHRPLAAPPRASAPDIRSLYRDKDEFEAVIVSVGHSKDPLSLEPFAGVPPFRGLSEAPRGPRGRKGTFPGGEKGRAASVRQWDPIIERAAAQTGVDANYLRAMMRAESSGNPDALSPAGAAGLMQFIPSTARRYGLKVSGEVDERRDPEKAIFAGARYFADLLEMYGGNHDLAVAAYNAGPGAVNQHKGIPPFPETRNHVKVVRDYYNNFRLGKY